jgi:hypothetical protein
MENINLEAGEKKDVPPQSDAASPVPNPLSPSPLIEGDLTRKLVTVFSVSSVLSIFCM